jgi:hypothetical protein
VTYLGFEITKDGVRPGANKIMELNNMPNPTNLKQVRQFLGLAGFFRKYINNFATLTKPLTKLLRKDVPWEWNEEQTNVIQTLKTYLTTRAILKVFNPDLTTEVHTDASKDGIAGMLLQVENKQKHVVVYFSCQTTTLESRYHSYELETLAVVDSFNYFRAYLIGTKFISNW